MTKTYFIKYKQFTAERFSIGNLVAFMTYDILYVEKYHTNKGCIFLFFFYLFFMHFFSGTKHPREDNPNLYYWAEMTGLHTQTFNI